MIKHLVEPGTMDYKIGLTVCGMLRKTLKHSLTTSSHKKVTCQYCMDVLKERKQK